MFANLKVGKTIKARTYLTTPIAPQTPWGVSPQAERLHSLFSHYQTIFANYLHS